VQLYLKEWNKQVMAFTVPIYTSWPKKKDQKALLSQSACMGNLGQDDLAGKVTRVNTTFRADLN